MVYGYVRISEYERNNNIDCLELQKEQLLNAGATRIYVDENSIVESHRPAFEELLGDMKKGDTLMVTTLDRIASSIKTADNLISWLTECGSVVHILNIGIMDNTDKTKQVRDILKAFAEFEHECFVERIQRGKYFAKKNENYKEGRPRVHSEEEIEKALRLLDKYSYKQVTEMTGISKSTLIRAKRIKEQKSE